MYHLRWAPATGGVRLERAREEGVTLGTSPRPVFHEELDMLGLAAQGWSYPRGEAPVMWAVNKGYYHCGRHLFDVRGANLYHAPEVVFDASATPGPLSAVDVEAMLRDNAEPLLLLENEAVEFIRDIYRAYHPGAKSLGPGVAPQLFAQSAERGGVANSSPSDNAAAEATAECHTADTGDSSTEIDYTLLAAKASKRSGRAMTVVRQGCDSFDIMPADTARRQGRVPLLSTRTERFIASFSGGKDSQVVLDLCTRALPPDAFAVVYSDTGYELPSSLRLWQQVQDTYGARFPALRFVTARNHQDILYYWDHIGTPSDTHRWCCSVMKTAPLYRSLKVGGRPSRVLCFDGVRAEESVRRSGYGRVGKAVKHNGVINARPILYWNATEIFLYHFKHHLIINEAYREGITRVGCVICPFSSDWNECIARLRYHKSLSPFVERLENNARNNGVHDVQQYLIEGNWKRRASGNNTDKDSFVEVSQTANSLRITMFNALEDVTEWLKTLGPYTKQETSEAVNIDLNFEKQLSQLTLRKSQDKTTLCIDNCANTTLLNQLRRVANKATYCQHCEACEVECPTGALSVVPTVTINAPKCIHCRKCLNAHDLGCVVAASLSQTIKSSMDKQTRIDRYNNFGLKTEWLEEFMSNPKDFWTVNTTLNKTYQHPALKKWLIDAEVVDDKGNVTELGNELCDIYPHDKTLVWEVIWINLSYNSYIIKWFTNNIDFEKPFTSEQLEVTIRDQQPTYREKTIHNGVYQLMRTLRESPIGSKFSQGSVVSHKGSNYTFARRPASTLTLPGMVYSLYRSMRERGVKLATVSDFYPSASGARPAHGPWAEFGLERSELEKALRWLTLQDNRVLVAELNMGLEHITLRDDLTPLAALRISIEQSTVASQQPAAQEH